MSHWLLWSTIYFHITLTSFKLLTELVFKLSAWLPIRTCISIIIPYLVCQSIYATLYKLGLQLIGWFALSNQPNHPCSYNSNVEQQLVVIIIIIIIFRFSWKEHLSSWIYSSGVQSTRQQSECKFCTSWLSYCKRTALQHKRLVWKLGMDWGVDTGLYWLYLRNVVITCLVAET